MHNRREFIGSSLAVGLAAVPIGRISGQQAPLFSISLAQWSLNRRIFGGQLDPIDLEMRVNVRRTGQSCRKFVDRGNQSIGTAMRRALLVERPTRGT